MRATTITSKSERRIIPKTAFYQVALVYSTGAHCSIDACQDYSLKSNEIRQSGNIVKTLNIP